MDGEFSDEEGGDRIEAISLVTGERRVLVRASVGAISALAVDIEDPEGQLYWADLKHKRLEAVNSEVDPVDRRVVVGEGVVEPVVLAVLGSWLYWADRNQASLTRVERLSSLASVPQLDLAVVRRHPCFQGDGCSH